MLCGKAYTCALLKFLRATDIHRKFCTPDLTYSCKVTKIYSTEIHVSSQLVIAKVVVWKFSIQGKNENGESCGGRFATKFLDYI